MSFFRDRYPTKRPDELEPDEMYPPRWITYVIALVAWALLIGFTLLVCRACS